MQEILGPDDVILSVSSSKTLQTCWKKYYLNYEVCIGPKRTASPLQIGDGCHQGLDVFYTDKDPKKALSHVRGVFQEKLEEVSDDEQATEDTESDRVIAMAMLVGYMVSHKPDEFPKILPEAEFFIQIWPEVKVIKAKDVLVTSGQPTGSPKRIFIAGKTDGLWQDDKGTWWLIEHKTTGETDLERYKKGLALDIQSTLYLVAAELLFNVPVHGVLYNIMRKPFIKPRVNESWEDFYSRLKYDYIARPTFYFHRHWIHRSPDARQLLVQEFLQMAHDLARKRYNGDWYRNTNACVSRGVCPYLSICTADDENQDRIIEIGYKKQKKFPELELNVEQQTSEEDCGL